MCPPHSQVPQAERARGTCVPASQQGTEFRLPMPRVQLLLLLARADPRGGPGGPGLRQSLAGGWIAAPTAGEATGLLLDRGCGDPPGHRCGIVHCPPGAGRDGLGSCRGWTRPPPCPPGPGAAVWCQQPVQQGAQACGPGSSLRPGLPHTLCRVACRVLL